MEVPEDMVLEATPVQNDCSSPEVKRGKRRKQKVSPLLYDTPRGALTRYHLRPSEVLKRRITLEPTRLSGSKRGTPTKPNRKSVAPPKRKKSVRFALEAMDSNENLNQIVKMEPEAEVAPRSSFYSPTIELHDQPAMSHAASPVELPDILPSVGMTRPIKTDIRFQPFYAHVTLVHNNHPLTVCDAMKVESQENTDDEVQVSETKKLTAEKNKSVPLEGSKLQRKNFVPAVKSKIPVHHKSKQSLALHMKCKKSTWERPSAPSQNTPKVAGYLRPTASSAAKSRPSVLASLMSNNSSTPVLTATIKTAWRPKTPAQKSAQVNSKTKTC